MLPQYSLSGVTIVTPDESVKNGAVEVTEGRISRIGETNGGGLELEPGLVLFPALVNVHDHLRGNYLPRVGPPDGAYYLKCAEWIKDLAASAVLKERAHLTAQECYVLSGYKNLLSGVVTVSDHYPHEENHSFIGSLPVRVVERYALAHEVSRHSLDWGDGIEIEHRRAVDKNWPFIVHVEEGFDEDYQRGIDVLDELGCLDEHSLLVHCLGLSEQDLQKVLRAGSTIAWCPGSNYFMFNVTCKIRKILKLGINCAIGTDSTHTGSINLLEEMRFARAQYKKMYGEVLDSRTIFDMVTINAARALRIEGEIGSIEAGKAADLLLLRSDVSDPYEALIGAQIEDIELLTWAGMPVYGDRKYRGFFGIDVDKYSDISIRGHDKFVLGDPQSLLGRVREKVGFEKELAYVPLDEYVVNSSE